MAIELRHLRYFRALADEGSFGRAAAAAGVSQSSMSEQIQRLEDVLGVILVDRRRRQVRLTPAGELLRGEVDALLDQVAGTVERVRLAGGAARGVLNVGYSEMAIGTAMPAILHDLRERHPSLEVNLSDQSSIGVAGALQSGRLDIAFVPCLEPPAGVGAVRLDALPLLLAVNADAPMACISCVALDEAARRPLILPDDGSVLTRYVLAAFARADVRVRMGARANRPLSMLTLVAAEQGVAFLPSSLAGMAPPGVVLRPLDPGLSLPFAMLWNLPTTNPSVTAAVALTRKHLLTARPRPTD